MLFKIIKGLDLVMEQTVVILCAGGPAPGINTVIASIARKFLVNGWRVIGLHGGYGPLFKEEQGDNWLNIDLKMTDRIQGRGGSSLRMSRYKPKDAEFRSDFFEKHNVKLLVTIGGDDTASTASRVSDFLASKNLDVRTIHVPKTIDNDLPLPDGIPTFGYQSAKEEGARIGLTVSEDARTNGNWFVVSAMGREAGHLAFGIGEACHAAMIIVPEMFDRVACTFDRIIRLMVSSIVKRQLLGLDYGIIVVSEGVFHFITDEEIANSGIQFTYDEHGHPELGVLSKGQLFNTLLQRKLKEVGLKIKSRPNDLGYELRCVRPIAFDLAYCSQLGLGVWKLFTEGKTGCMVTLDGSGHITPLYLKDLKDPETGKVKPRLLNINCDRSQQVFEGIMHYLSDADLEQAKKYLANPAEFEFRSILGWS